MKVLHINSYYAAGKFYKNLFDRQIKSGLDIDVFVPVPSSFKQSYFDYGNYTKISRNHRRYDRYIFHLKHYKIYKDVVSKYIIENYSLVHAHSLFSNGYIAMKLKLKYETPYIVAVRDTDANFFFKKIPYLRGTGIKILKEAKKIIFLSKTYRDLVIEKYIPTNLKKEIFDKSSIIPNGIDDFWLDNINVDFTDKMVPDKKNLKLLQVGMISRRKNVITTVKAVEILNKKGFNVTLTVVGKVIDNKIYNQIKDLSYVNYVSPKPKEELLNKYRENDIFVMPSITETFGLVYAEAMSQGLPIIYSKGQGFDGQFKEGEVGFHVNSKDEYEIADRIIQVLEDYQELSKRGANLANTFNWNNITEKYIKIYKSLIPSNGG